jgi:hypothetical protein
LLAARVEQREENYECGETEEYLHVLCPTVTVVWFRFLPSDSADLWFSYVLDIIWYVFSNL